MRILRFVVLFNLLCAFHLTAQVRYSEKGQAIPSATQHLGKEAFAPSNQTVIRWLGNAGFFINSRGTCIMVDPLLIGFDMPLLIEPPILPEEVPALDAVKVANAYPDAQLLLSHWGTVDAPDMKPFNADPKDLEGRIVNPERIYVLAPGEAFVMKP